MRRRSRSGGDTMIGSSGHASACARCRLRGGLSRHGRPLAVEVGEGGQCAASAHLRTHSYGQGGVASRRQCSVRGSQAARTRLEPAPTRPDAMSQYPSPPVPSQGAGGIGHESGWRLVAAPSAKATSGLPAPAGGRRPYQQLAAGRTAACPKRPPGGAGGSRRQPVTADRRRPRRPWGDHTGGAAPRSGVAPSDRAVPDPRRRRPSRHPSPRSAQGAPSPALRKSQPARPRRRPPCQTDRRRDPDRPGSAVLVASLDADRSCGFCREAPRTRRQQILQP